MNMPRIDKKKQTTSTSLTSTSVEPKSAKGTPSWIARKADRLLVLWRKEDVNLD